LAVLRPFGRVGSLQAAGLEPEWGQMADSAADLKVRSALTLAARWSHSLRRKPSMPRAGAAQIA